MGQERATLRIRANPRTMELLARLRDDQHFRDALIEDPRGALAEYGVPTEDVPSEIVLPESDEVGRLIDEASDPDEFGLITLPPESASSLYSFFFALVWAMALVPADV